jgi:RHS repeat-associated protein
VWSYPNIHGDVMSTANAAGAKQGPTLTYDPYGQALAGIPDNSDGNFDYGWLGRHQRGTEHAGAAATIEMGARQYVPGLGRFLEVDPVEGGCANDYTYVHGDPINQLDLDGEVADCESGTAREYGVRAKVKSEFNKKKHVMEWHFELHVINWWDQLITNSVRVWIRDRTGRLSHGRDKRSRLGFGPNYRAHTKIATRPGDELQFYGQVKIRGPGYKKYVSAAYSCTVR